MANSPHPKKHRYAYLEHKEVLEVLQQIADERGVAPSEIIREMTLELANKTLRKNRKPPLKLNPSSDAWREE